MKVTRKQALAGHKYIKAFRPDMRSPIFMGPVWARDGFELPLDLPWQRMCTEGSRHGYDRVYYTMAKPTPRQKGTRAFR